MQNAKNETSQQKDISLQELQSENQPTKNSPPSPDAPPSTNINMNRMTFLALLEAAMRYREAFWRESVDDYRGAVITSINAYEGKRDKGWEKRAAKKADYMVQQFQQKIEEFNRNNYKEIESVVNMLTKESQSRFDNFSTAFAILAEELFKAKNTTELLTVAKLYNEGHFEETFQQLKERQNENIKPQEPIDSNIDCNISTDDVSKLPKEGIDSPNSITDHNTGEPEVRHEQSGQVPNDLEQQGERTGHDAPPDPQV